MKIWVVWIAIMLSMIACNGEEKSQTKATSDEYKFVDIDTLPEKYVEVKLFEKKWGTGEDELGRVESAPIEGPGPFIVYSDRVFISDQGNQSLKEFGINGELMKCLINEHTITKMFLAGDSIFMHGKKESNVIIYEIQTGITTEIKENKEKEKIILKENAYIENIVSTEAYEAKVNEMQKGLNKLYLGADSLGNRFYGIDKIFKFDKKGLLLSIVQLPSKNFIGEYRDGMVQIDKAGNIYYLYPQGSVLEKEWQIDFIPDKVLFLKYQKID
ncbi:MAG: hypothetical protein PHW02_01980 [bacterium]|nr:hypothetical protein [bacterium]